jgi:hypothetical protein
MIFFLSEQAEDVSAFTGAFVHILRADSKLYCDGEEVALPKPAFLLDAEIAANTLSSWQPMFTRLERIISPQDYLMFHYNDPYREFGLYFTALQRFRFGLAFCTPPDRVYAKDYIMFGSAAFLMFANATVEAALRKVYVTNYPRFPDCLAKTKDTARTRRTAKGDGPNILLVSYFFGDSRTVGVQRTNYWHARIPELYPGATVTTATATPGKYPDGRVVVVPDLGSAHLLDPLGQPLPWASAFIETEKENARNFSTLSHFWRIGLERYFKDLDEVFDIVIISGNPFPVFDFAAFAKRQWSCRVILDYRDPFANNPRILYKPEAREWARYIERGHNFQADLVTVVNAHCIPLVEAGDELNKAIVPNGYDERWLQDSMPRFSETDGLVHFVHAGTFYHYNSPGDLIASFRTRNHKFHQIGNTPSSSFTGLGVDAIECHGSLPYDEVLTLISQCDCGVVFVSESGFDTPTKMYDYLAHGLDLLIVSPGRVKAGAVADRLEGLDGVFWVSNTQDELSAFLRAYSPSPSRRRESQTNSFSRRESTMKLCHEIRILLNS